MFKGFHPEGGPSTVLESTGRPWEALESRAGLEGLEAERRWEALRTCKSPGSGIGPEIRSQRRSRTWTSAPGPGQEGPWKNQPATRKVMGSGCGYSNQ